MNYHSNTHNNNVTILNRYLNIKCIIYYYYDLSIVYFVVWKLLLDRPGFNRYHFCPDRLVFFYVDGPVHDVVPDRWVVGSVHHVDLDLDTPRQRRVSLILGSGFQLVRLALYIYTRRNGIITHAHHWWGTTQKYVGTMI